MTKRMAVGNFPESCEVTVVEAGIEVLRACAGFALKLICGV
jgi:hypothetical protein